MDTVPKLAQLMYDTFKSKKRPDGSYYVALDESNPMWGGWMRDVCFKAHLDRLPDDDTYQVIMEATELIAQADDEDRAMDLIYEMEPDVYTHDLTAWLNSHSHNQEYVNNAMKEYHPETIDQAIAMGQAAWKQEVAGTVLQELIDLADDEWEEDE